VCVCVCIFVCVCVCVSAGDGSPPRRSTLRITCDATVTGEAQWDDAFEVPGQPGNYVSERERGRPRERERERLSLHAPCRRRADGAVSLSPGVRLSQRPRLYVCSLISITAVANRSWWCSYVPGLSPSPPPPSPGPSPSPPPPANSCKVIQDAPPAGICNGSVYLLDLVNPGADK
jgi:hypothetical protein